MLFLIIKNVGFHKYIYFLIVQNYTNQDIHSWNSFDDSMSYHTYKNIVFAAISVINIHNLQYHKSINKFNQIQIKVFSN